MSQEHRKIKPGTYRVTLNRGTVFPTSVCIKQSKSQLKVLPSLVAQTWASSIPLRTLTQQGVRWVSVNCPAPTSYGYRFYFVTKLKFLHRYSFFRSTRSMTAHNFKNQKEHCQQHNHKPELLRWVSTTLDDQKLTKDYYSVKVSSCKGNQTCTFKGSEGSPVIEERLRSISSNNIFEFAHIKSYYYFPHFNSLKIKNFLNRWYIYTALDS